VHGVLWWELRAQGSRFRGCRVGLEMQGIVMMVYAVGFEVES